MLNGITAKVTAETRAQLVAALNVLNGEVVGRCMQKRRHQEYISFLNAVDATVPAGKGVHAIVDNYATHKHPKVREWLEAHPWRTFHFTPASASWLNAVEGFVAKLTKRRLTRGVFRSVEELKNAIRRFLAENNEDPRPFQWTKNPKEIWAAVKRGHQVLDSIHSFLPPRFLPFLLVSHLRGGLAMLGGAVGEV
jgi:transposase